MAFDKKTWENRVSQYPGRQQLIPVPGEENVYDAVRADGEASVEGDKVNASSMNDLENRIAEGMDGKLSKSGDLPENKVMVTGTNGAIETRDVTPAELDNLKGSTENIQQAINSLKESGGGGIPTITQGTGTNSEAFNGIPPINVRGANSHAHGNGCAIYQGGTNGFVSGYRSSTAYENTSVMGYELESGGAHQTVIGKRNEAVFLDASPGDRQGTAFVIGNGISESVRTNAFRVDYNGDVYICDRGKGETNANTKLQDLISAAGQGEVHSDDVIYDPTGGNLTSVITELDANKVDKKIGWDLSPNPYTDEEKQKLASLVPGGGGETSVTINGIGPDENGNIRLSSDDIKYDDTDSSITEILGTKVDKASGKGLSTNDYTTPEKQKLATLENYDDSELDSRVTALENSSGGGGGTTRIADGNGGNSLAYNGQLPAYASGTGANAFGYTSTASGNYSMATGQSTTAAGLQSFSGGLGTYAQLRQFVIGSYNSTEEGYTYTTKPNGIAFAIGGGNASNARRTAFKVGFDGDIYYSDYSDGVTSATLNLQQTLRELKNSSGGGSGGGKTYSTLVIGTEEAGYTADDVDVLCNGTSDTTRINTAMLSAGDNTRVFLLAGTYNLTTNLLTTTNNITIEGEGPGTILSCTRNGINVATDNVTIKNLNIVCSDTSSVGYGVNGIKGSNCKIHDCEISGFAFGTTGAGIYGTVNFRRFEIKRCFIHDCAIGVNMVSSQEGQVTECQINETSRSGVQFSNGINIQICNNQFLNSANSGAAVYLGLGCQRNVVSNNVISNLTAQYRAGNAIYVIGAYQNIITGNQISFVTNAFYTDEMATNMIVTSNIISNVTNANLDEFDNTNQVANNVVV